LEAYVNETYVDREHFLKEEARALLESFKKKYEGGDFDKTTLLAKFHLIIFAQGGTHMDKGARPYQDIDALIQLRNGLVHFRPEWDTDAGKHKTISSALNRRFNPSPFISGPEGLFPRRWATHGCTAWAVRSCLAFTAEFESRAGLSSKYGQSTDRLQP
jgi:hypothetical protein